jgi:hypothetical protein
MNLLSVMSRVVGLLIILATLQSCSSSVRSPSFPQAPTVVIPDDYTTFTDPSEIFSIRYPDDWSLDLSESANEFLDSSPLDVDFSSVSSVFSAGDETHGGYEPNVNIVLETVPDNYDADNYSEGGIKFIRETLSSGSIDRQQSVQLGNLHGQIVEWSYDLREVFPGESGRWHVVGIMAKRVGEDHGWSISCAFGDFAPAESRRTCELVISSFKLLD